MKVNGQKGIKMAVQGEFSTLEIVIRRHYKALDHWGLNHMENKLDDGDKAGIQNKRKLHTQSS